MTSDDRPNETVITIESTGDGCWREVNERLAAMDVSPDDLSGAAVELRFGGGRRDGRQEPEVTPAASGAGSFDVTDYVDESEPSTVPDYPPERDESGGGGGSSVATLTTEEAYSGARYEGAVMPDTIRAAVLRALVDVSGWVTAAGLVRRIEGDGSEPDLSRTQVRNAVYSLWQRDQPMVVRRAAGDADEARWEYRAGEGAERALALGRERSQQEAET